MDMTLKKTYNYQPDCFDIMCGSYNGLILNSAPAVFSPSDRPEIHMLLCERDIIAALWCLKTFRYYSGCETGLVIHDDGSISEKSACLLKEHLKGCVIISRRDADEKMRSLIRGRRFLNEYRFGLKYHIFALKLLDFLFLSKTSSYMMIDADILFFSYPKQIMECLNSGMGFFMNDSINAYALKKERLDLKYPFKVLDRVNAGLMFIPDKSIYEMDFIEEYLEMAFYKENEAVSFWLEQTLQALVVSWYPERFARLDSCYQISAFDDDPAACPIKKDTAAHHFAAGKMNSIAYYRSIRNLCKNNFLENLK